ncbi:hypothetical protein [Halohasta litchfieldiae]|jgi:hypothetical protein|uniref:hypothetical protein n=1 Tax=Halohasta litchfieldiae TaxID=1073996 RepID=UPI0013A582A5|nr:hypothetical protein [Halohasta litchfieldiae]
MRVVEHSRRWWHTVVDSRLEAAFWGRRFVRKPNVMGRIQSVPTADTFKKATCFPWMIGSDVAGDRTAYLW